jgi:hypothetical protein
MPSPSLIDLAISATPATTSSKVSSCTNSREPATQHCPWLKKIALAAPAIAASGSASENTMFGLLPPSSSVSFFRFPAAAWTISLPTSVEPVKATLSTSVVGGEGGTGGLAEARDDVDHAVRDARLGDQLGQSQRGERRLLGRLEDDAVACARAPGRASMPPSAAGSSTG